jgi:hypothetical protein
MRARTPKMPLFQRNRPELKYSRALAASGFSTNASI